MPEPELPRPEEQKNPAEMASSSASTTSRGSGNGGGHGGLHADGRVARAFAAAQMTFREEWCAVARAQRVCACAPHALKKTCFVDGRPCFLREGVST